MWKGSELVFWVASGRVTTSEVLREELELSQSALGIRIVPDRIAEAMLHMVLDEFALGVGDSVFNREQLLRARSTHERPSHR